MVGKGALGAGNSLCSGSEAERAWLIQGAEHHPL